LERLERMFRRMLAVAGCARGHGHSCDEVAGRHRPNRIAGLAFAGRPSSSPGWSRSDAGLMSMRATHALSDPKFHV
jgi:hypothetical protein